MGDKRKKSVSVTTQKASDLHLGTPTTSIHKDSQHLQQPGSTSKASRKALTEEQNLSVRKASSVEQQNSGTPSIVGPFETLLSQQKSQILPQGKVPNYQNNINYYHEFWKMFYQNEVIIAKVMEQQLEINNLHDKSKQLMDMIHHFDEAPSQEQDSKSQQNTTQKIKKKNRRCAGEIQKDFGCPYENCAKTYGSEVSLNLHIKLKHNGGNKTERERLARQICAAKLNGEKIPEMNLTLPPGFMEEINNGNIRSDYLKPKTDKPAEQKATPSSVPK